MGREVLVIRNEADYVRGFIIYTLVSKTMERWHRVTPTTSPALDRLDNIVLNIVARVCGEIFGLLQDTNGDISTSSYVHGGLSFVSVNGL